jgi:hypothetical protein
VLVSTRRIRADHVSSQLEPDSPLGEQPFAVYENRSRLQDSFALVGLRRQERCVECEAMCGEVHHPLHYS